MILSKPNRIHQNLPGFLFHDRMDITRRSGQLVSYFKKLVLHKYLFRIHYSEWV